MLTKVEKLNLTTTEIAKKIRQKIKKELPSVKFSIRSEYFSMGSAIDIYLMETPFEIFDKSKLFDLNGNQISWDYAQLNHYTFMRYSHEEADGYNNGHYLTKMGWDLFKNVLEFIQYYNFDESDPQTDYFNVNFYFHLQVGKWDKPFKLSA